MVTRKEFSPDTKKKVLLWSDRHCCLCGKSCGIDIEIHHIDGVDNNDIENALPLCYDCHAKLHHYNTQYPMGTKYKPDELVARRDQIYERYTHDLVPPISIELRAVNNKNPKKPRVGTIVRHLSDSNPVRLQIIMNAYLGKKSEGVINSPYYDGKIIWNMNPRAGCVGNFGLKQEWLESKEKFIIEVDLRKIDIYEREHPQLLYCYSLVKPDYTWNYEPAEYSEVSKKL